MAREEVTYGFLSGIAISAFTNLLTRIDKTHLCPLRVFEFSSMAAFFVSAVLFFYAAVRATRASEARRAAGDPPDSNSFLKTYGVIWRALFGFIALLSGFLLLMMDIAFDKS